MPNPMLGMIGASTAAGAYGAHQQRGATEDAIAAQERASEASTEESARQFDTVREDTRVARETGDQAMIALGFLMGTRQPPSAENISQMETELAEAQQLRARSVAANSGGSSGGTTTVTETGRDGIPVAPTSPFGRNVGMSGVPAQPADIGAIDENIARLQSRLDSARMEVNMAMEMGGGRGQVPDINALFENVNLPTGANIGSPDDYLPDLDGFLQGLGRDLENSAGFQFEMKQGREALQATMTQKGTAYGGNALKEALQFSQDYASTKYGERHSQAIQEYGLAYQSGMTKYGMDVDKYGRERQQAIDQFGLNMDKYRLEKEQSDDYRSTLLTMSGYGPVGAQVSANAGQNYAQTVANANQNVASVVGQGAYANAGANTQALSNVVNTGMTMYQYNQMMNAYNARTAAGAAT